MGMTPMFETPEEMEILIDEYTASCVPEYLKDKNDEYVINAGKPVIVKENKPTITGLALYLGFESRQSMYDYKKKDNFSYIIKRATLFIENSYEVDLRSSKVKPVGAIFGLKNMGWSDKQDIKLDGRVEMPIIQFFDDPDEVE